MKTLDEIKLDVAKPKMRFQSVDECLHNNNLWPEVCRRAQLECAREITIAFEKGVKIEAFNEGIEAALSKFTIPAQWLSGLKEEIEKLKKVSNEKGTV